MFKILIFVGLVPCVITILVATLFGSRRVASKLEVGFTGRQLAKMILKGKNIEIKEKASWWSGLNPFDGDSLKISKAMLEQKTLYNSVQVIHRCGLALLQEVHEGSVNKYYHTMRFVSIVPIFMIVASVLGKVIGRYSFGVCLTVAVWGIALACLACVFNFMTSREAVKRALHELDKKNAFKRMSDQEQVENAAFGFVYMQIAPPLMGPLVKWKE